jgi:hypothetical protein
MASKELHLNEHETASITANDIGCDDAALPFCLDFKGSTRLALNLVSGKRTNTPFECRLITIDCDYSVPDTKSVPFIARRNQGD